MPRGFRFGQIPELGTEVQFDAGVHRGKSGYIYELRGIKREFPEYTASPSHSMRGLRVSERRSGRDVPPPRTPPLPEKTGDGSLYAGRPAPVAPPATASPSPAGYSGTAAGGSTPASAASPPAPAGTAEGPASPTESMGAMSANLGTFSQLVGNAPSATSLSHPAAAELKDQLADSFSGAGGAESPSPSNLGGSGSGRRPGDSGAGTKMFDDDAGAVRVLVKFYEGEGVVDAFVSELSWKPTMPALGTTVKMVYLASVEGVEGTVVGYENVATTHWVDTSIGRHYGLKAAVVQTAAYGKLAVLTDNLVWDPEAVPKDAKSVECIPPPGPRVGDIDPSLLVGAGQTKTSEERSAELAKKRPKSALYQLSLLSGRVSCVMVRDRPHVTGNVAKQLQSGDVCSIVLPKGDPAADPPAGWHRLLSGGFFRIPKYDTEVSATGGIDELRPLSMSCPVCGEGFATEQHAREHFFNEHPDEYCQVKIGAGDPNLGATKAPAYQCEIKARIPQRVKEDMQHNSALPGPQHEIARRQEGRSPAWFNLKLPRRGLAPTTPTTPSTTTQSPPRRSIVYHKAVIA